MLRAAILALALAGAPWAASAQGAPEQVQSPILTIDLDRLLDVTRFGQRLADDLQARVDALDAENEQLRLELVEEERSLTERRPSMEVDAFRAEADAFDARVQRIRAEQDAKQAALAASVEQDRRTFLDAVTPILGRLMVDSGAVVILDQRDVFLRANAVDITDEAIAAIDAELGDGPTSSGTEADEPPPMNEEAGPAVLSPEAGADPLATEDGG
jgi:Skp family chaperone for outer membrane proteins